MTSAHGRTTVRYSASAESNTIFIKVHQAQTPPRGTDRPCWRCGMTDRRAPSFVRAADRPCRRERYTRRETRLAEPAAHRVEPRQDQAVANNIDTPTRSRPPVLPAYAPRGR